VLSKFRLAKLLDVIVAVSAKIVKVDEAEQISNGTRIWCSRSLDLLWSRQHGELEANLVSLLLELKQAFH